MTDPRPDLEFFGVYERGVPNIERIALKVNARVNTADYGLILGLRGNNDTIVPATDHFLWLGRMIVDPGWVIIYTGRGDPMVSMEANTNEPMHVLYWGKDHTVFNHPDARAALVRFATVQVGTRDQTIAEYLSRKNAIPAIAQDVPEMNNIDWLMKYFNENPPGKP